MKKTLRKAAALLLVLLFVLQTAGGFAAAAEKEQVRITEKTPLPDENGVLTKARVLFVGNICHQVFGKWNGTVTLDDGTVPEIHDMIAFCEDSDNMW